MSHDNLGFSSSTSSVDCKKQKSLPWVDKNKYPAKGNANGNHVVEMVDKQCVEKIADEYDPYQHREVDHPTTYMDTLIHLLKGSLGTGILAMPNAFYNAGWAVGLVGTVIIGLLCTYCIRILVASEYELCKRRKVASLTYPGTTEAALEDGPKCLRRFSRQSAHLTNIFLLIYQLGSCCVYVVFIAENMRFGLTFWLGEQDVRIYMLVILLPLILINWIRSLKFLTPFSTLANGLTFMSFGIIVYYLSRDDLSFEKREAVGKVENFPLYFGTTLFALEAIGVIMPLVSEMKKPKSFVSTFGVLHVGMGFIIFLYVAMGFFGYICFGSETKGSITLNLPKEEVAAQICQLCLALAIFITHALQCYVAIDITWNDYVSNFVDSERYKTFCEYVVRTLLVLLTFALAAVIPQLENFISLFGSLCLSALGLAFPALIQICTLWSMTTQKEKSFLIAKNGALILIGVLGLVAELLS